MERLGGLLGSSTLRIGWRYFSSNVRVGAVVRADVRGGRMSTAKL